MKTARDMPDMALEKGREQVPLLEMVDVTKTFSRVRANDRVSLALLPGEIHALLGENGAGKSTLMNVLYGLYQPDEGEIRLRGEAVVFESPGMRSARGSVWCTSTSRWCRP